MNRLKHEPWSFEPDEPEIEDAELSPKKSSAHEPALDSIQQYFDEIGRVALLRAAEEVELAERIERGLAAATRLAALDPPATALRAAFEADIADGHAARRQLIQANLRLVVSVAKKYVGHGLPLLDLIQEGNIGLMRAVEKFDYRRGHRFSTYATWWIRQGVRRALAERSRIIRLPVHMSEAAVRVTRAAERLSQSLGRRATAAEIAATIDQPVERVEIILRLARGPISLETPVGEEGDQTLGDFLTNEQLPSPIDLAAQHMLEHDLAGALGRLSERERRIITLRYGLADGRTHTLDEVGRELGMTRERARQIEAEVLRRLRQSVGPRLRDYLE
ncbi:MAG: sigma-70 family RNA polymerase sigma factor [Kouleothrix sp.]|nr:sigma-70 family RNA polymerase sigma factor [Kouleothrix sp.]